ncbi:MAG TPA: tetratricopeptide repeat protein [Candidatus Baltobacteraceae bacterium]|nr:tetratricopeptide repeat protein [Candidatus Baltobacteraceae bacterium]
MNQQVEAQSTGVLTFVFTDVEGSSRLWERSAAAMQTAMKTHAAVLNEAIDAHAGRMFKQVGDGFCCVFERPQDAVASAVDIQRGLASARWPAQAALRVRIGIHSGTALKTQGGEFEGATLSRVSRLTAAGHGGQILLSAGSAALVRDGLEPGVELRSLGTHRLRDLAHEESIFQLIAPGLETDFKDLRTMDTHPNNLPSQISSFVGRDEEIRAIIELLAQHRVLTIAGGGGIGKTRLSLEVAAEVAPQFDDGCWFVALADVQDATLVVPAIAAALDIREDPSRPIIDTVAAWLRQKRLVLLLDNSEHLLSSVAHAVARLSAECGGVTFVITSREPTHLTGECVVRIDPLRLADARELFLQRARAAGLPENVETDAESIESICRQLDGIPLAIELAAGRSQLFSPRELAEALRAHSGLLVSKNPLESPRHRTLSATIEWSFDLLDAAEKRLLLDLSIFDGGFITQSAQEVAGASQPAATFVDLLESLVDKSFVTFGGSAGCMRFRILDPIRSFLADRLRSDSKQRLAQRHFEYFRRLAASWNDQAAGTKGAVTAFDIERELPNLRAALAYAFDRPVKAPAIELLIDVVAFWQYRGNVGEGRAWLERALACEDVEPAARAALLRRAATFASKQDDYDVARSLCRQSLEIFRSLHDTQGTAEALHALAVVEHYTGNFEAALELYGEALEGFDASGYVHGQITSLTNSATILGERGEQDEARRVFHKSVRLARECGKPADLSGVLSHHASFELQCGQVDVAEPLFKEALDLKRRIGSREDLTEILANLALLNARRGKLDDALTYAAEELQLAIEDRGKAMLIPAFEVFCVLYLRAGDVERAVELLEFATALRERSHYGVETRITAQELETIRAHTEERAHARDRRDVEDPLDVAARLLQETTRLHAG